MRDVLNKKIIIRALVLFIVVILFLGLPYRFMGFDSDCFGYIYRVGHGSFTLKEFFCKPISICYAPVNEVIDSAKASMLYRPLPLCFIYWLYQFFGTHAYPYFLLSILFHAFSCVLIYLIFLQVVFDPYALFLALLVAVFPSHTPSLLGITSFIIICYTLCFLALFLWVLFKQTRHWYWYIGSGLLFFSSLFVYEMPLIFPFVICWYLFIFDRKNFIKDSWLFFVFEALYFLLRYCMIGCKSFTAGSGLIQLIVQIPDNIIQAIKPFFGMQDASWPVVAILLFLLILLFVVYCAFKKDERIKMLFYSTAFIACSWPIFLCNSSSRYFYLAVPFFCLLLYELICFVSEFLFGKKEPLFILGSLFFCIGWSGFYTTRALIQREAYTHGRDIAYARLTRFIKTPQDKIVVIGSLHAYNHEVFLMFSGVSQAISLFTGLDQKNIFHVKEAAIMGQHDTQSCFDILPVPGGYRFVSQEPKKLFMMCPYGWKEGVPVLYSMGTIIPHHIDNGWKCTDLSIMFDKRWLINLEYLRIVTWNPARWDFEELPTDHLR